MIVAQSYSELSQTRAMNLREIRQQFYSLTISTKTPLLMLNYAQKMPLIIYDTK